MSPRSLGILLASLGMLLVVAGALLTGGVRWFGRLPGDLRPGRGGLRVPLPLASLAVLALSLLLFVHVVLRLAGR